MSRSATYRGEPHALIPFDRNCQNCDLHSSEANQCVGGAGPDDLNQVKLILVSDYIGHYEKQMGFPMATNEEKRQESKSPVKPRRNAGGMMRLLLDLAFGLDTYNEVWTTNALKCDPGKKDYSKAIASCSLKWLQQELLVLDQFVPAVPILAAGKVAHAAISLLYPEANLPNSLQDCRRRGDLRAGDHPLCFTSNPAGAAKSEPRLVTRVGRTKSGKAKVLECHDWWPPLEGSPIWHTCQDLRLLVDYL